MTTYREVTPEIADIFNDNGFLFTTGTGGPTEISAVVFNDDDAGYTRFNSDTTTAYRYYYWAADTARPIDFQFLTLKVRARADAAPVNNFRFTAFVRNPTPTGTEDNYSFSDGSGTYQMYSQQSYVYPSTTWETAFTQPLPYLTGHGTLGVTGAGSLDFYDAYLAGNFAIRVEAETGGDGTNIDLTYLALLISVEESTLVLPNIATVPLGTEVRYNPLKVVM